MIHPASIACAKPDLRYQRSFASGCGRGESTLVASGLPRKPTWGRQHHLAPVRVLEADWRRTFPSALPKYRLGRMNLDERIPQSTPSFTFFEKSLGDEKAPPPPASHCKKKSPTNPHFIGIGGRWVGQDVSAASLRSRLRLDPRATAACGPCGNQGTAREPRKQPEASRSR